VTVMHAIADNGF